MGSHEIASQFTTKVKGGIISSMLHLIIATFVVLLIWSWVRNLVALPFEVLMRLFKVSDPVESSRGLVTVVGAVIGIYLCVWFLSWAVPLVFRALFPVI